ncbi:phage holin, LLH family [Convivina praedatoris]|uniref:phage holin, LLH family n=1 Tax=Convivina praedatoris TaxID=2880963 RepID=UPI00200C4B95|nr:phage holin, LLH family [Convivina sp. LMG 32447]CAH1855087.1 hypothetical protein R078138_01056 [Convivina sp. LMG 32447]
MNNVVDTLATIGTLIVLGAPVVHGVVKFLKSKTKNNNVQLFLGWVDQAVGSLENSDLSGTEKKYKAISYVSNRLVANNLVGKFSEQQISAAIEMAVNALHTSNAESVTSNVNESEQVGLPTIKNYVNGPVNGGAK